MFYSETLLSKTGPLARVWLAANLERKLSKSNILQSNIESSVSAIVDQGQAPMALRLSGQLLLGVVRIYSRKARYLLDDCNEALMKIKMAFRPGKVDLPIDHAVHPASLVLPDVLTELDPLAPMPDLEALLAEPPGAAPWQQDPTLLDWGTQSLLSASVERGRAPAEPLPLDEEGLVLDIGEEPTEISIEAGRREAPPRTLAEEMREEPSKLYEEELELEVTEEPLRPPIGVPEIEMEGMEPLPGIEEEERAASPARARVTVSPLSPIPSEVERTFEEEREAALEAEEEAARQAQRIKRRRVLPADIDTEIRSSQIHAQQADRSAILRPASFLPRDPMLLALMTMQRTGGFVSSVLGDGRAQGWAPELRGVLSVEVVRRSGDLKRKRISGVAEMEAEAARAAAAAAAAARERTPRLELPSEIEPEPFPRAPTEELEMEAGVASPAPAFDETMAPLLTPAEAGPVSVATRRAVHELRERFGPAAAESADERQRRSVLFQEMLPEATTSRQDATKMFFEVLVLATKDAIRVEQAGDVLGAPIRIRGKRGLWGAWAEEEMGTESQAAEGAGAGAGAGAAATVAVGA